MQNVALRFCLEIICSFLLCFLLLGHPSSDATCEARAHVGASSYGVCTECVASLSGIRQSQYNGLLSGAAQTFAASVNFSKRGRKKEDEESGWAGCVWMSASCQMLRSLIRVVILVGSTSVVHLPLHL